MNNFITSNHFLNISDYVLMKNYPVKNLNYKYLIPDKVKKNDIIFVKSDNLYEFEKILKYIKQEIILITGNSDIIIDDKYFNILNNNKIIKWFAVNTNINHNKIVNIPLGIQNEHLYIYNNPQSNPKNLNDIINTKINIEKNVLLSFNINTNINHRKPIYDKLKYEKFINIRNFKREDRFNEHFIKEYYKEIKKHKYVICPLGNGPDCHRYWEVLYLGSIPIIQKHKALDNFFKNNKLPVLYINDIKNINEKLLDEEYYKIKNKKYDLSKIYFNYWKEKILNLK